MHAKVVKQLGQPDFLYADIPPTGVPGVHQNHASRFGRWQPGMRRLCTFTCAGQDGG